MEKNTPSNTHRHTETVGSWQVVVKDTHTHTLQNKALQTSGLPQQSDLSRIGLCVVSRPPGRVLAAVEASGEPGQMNDAELQDGDLISGLFSVPLWVNRLQDAARVRPQRKLKVKVTCPRHCRWARSVIAASFFISGGERGGQWLLSS